MRDIAEYRNTNTGRLFILGNGPSLLDYDLSLLKVDQTMTMNRTWRAIPGAMYHCCSGDLTGIRQLPQHVLFLGQPEQYPRVPKSLQCPVILVQTRIMGVRIPKVKPITGIAPELDLRRGWPPTHCGLFAVFAAHWLGFKEVFLLGYDGYGGHCTAKDADHIPDHAKVVPEFKKHVSTLLALADPVFKVYNCNPNNAYGNLPIAFYEELW